jgi:hypothetical protein
MTDALCIKISIGQKKPSSLKAKMNIKKEVLEFCHIFSQLHGCTGRSLGDMKYARS